MFPHPQSVHALSAETSVKTHRSISAINSWDFEIDRQNSYVRLGLSPDGFSGEPLEIMGGRDQKKFSFSEVLEACYDALSQAGGALSLCCTCMQFCMLDSSHVIFSSFSIQAERPD